LVFAAFRIQTEKIIVELTIRREIKSPRFTKVLHFQKQRWAYFLDIKDSKDIDDELIGWTKEACE
jgi:tRNA A37 threonylcarbamoyladenosine biosynthesis protein TsaE